MQYEKLSEEALKSMLETVLDICLDAVIDCLKILPFLFAVYLFIEFAEHKSSHKFAHALTKLGPFGAVGGAALGCVPQCGFSVMAANLYSGRLISLGTLVAIFISTSDEAVPMIISRPDKIGALWKLILSKLVIAVIAGIIVDVLVKIFRKKKDEDEPFHELCSHCGCGHHSIWVSALKHTAGIIIFILIVNVLLNSAIEFIGEERIGKLLMTDSFFQPFIAAVIGFIPNCAASVIITELYLDGVLSFGSVVAGLCTGAGVGLAVLFRTNKRLSENFLVMGILYVTAVAAGTIINLI